MPLPTSLLPKGTALAALLLLGGAPGGAARAQVDQAARLDEASRRYVQQVIENIRDQELGRGTVRDLHLPESFLERLADYEIRWSFQIEHHRVVRDRPDPQAPPATTPDAQASVDGITIHRVEPPAKAVAERRRAQAGRPPLRNFRAPVLEGATADSASDTASGAASGAASDAASDAALDGQPGTSRDAAPSAGAHAGPGASSGRGDPDDLLRAEVLVARHLAPDGLLPTLARVVDLLGPERFSPPDDLALADLRACGLPLDLLVHLPLADGTRNPTAMVDAIARRLADGHPATSPAPEWTGLPFRFVPTRPGFRAATESGEHDLALLRLQLARGTPWRGPGGGDSVDMARQLAAALPDTRLLVSLAEEHLDDFVHTVRGWSHGVADRLTLVAEPMAVTQWTQDGGKAGSVPVSSGDGRRAATLVPRFASKRNDGSEYVPGDSWLAEGLRAAGHVVHQSPLLFQGGNLLVVRDPARDERVLLMSQAEVLRNVALGLAEDQVREAFRVELDVDRVVVLPVVAFHLDYDLTARVHDGELVVFVNDVDAAVTTIVELGIGALARAGALDPQAHGAALEHLRAGREPALIGLVKPALWRLMAPRRAFPASLADHFSTGVPDSGIGNLQRFLVALDLVTSRHLSGSGLPLSPQAHAYLTTFRRTRAAREQLHRLLREQGWRVEPVPSFPFAERSITAINGVHGRGVYLMPAHGGLYAPLDRAAEAAFGRVLGDAVEVVGILSAESQRRSGAVHCSVAAYPVP